MHFGAFCFSENGVSFDSVSYRNLILVHFVYLSVSVCVCGGVRDSVCGGGGFDFVQLE